MPENRIWDSVARQAVRLWRGEENSLQWVGLSESAVYTFALGGSALYLRLTAPEHRSRQQIEAELAFVCYLHEGGARVCRPLASHGGLRVEPIQVEAEQETSSLYHACVFEEAMGSEFRYDTADSPEAHFRTLGRTLGRIHALSKLYSPEGCLHRFSWQEEATFTQIERYLPRSETVIWEEFQALSEWLHHEPLTPETFGLIHGDAGATNYRWHDGQITVFDFDDCCSHWFAYDLAIVLYPHGWRPEAAQLYEALVGGYSQETAWDGRSLSEMTLWCRLRMLYMFLHHVRKWGEENLSDRQKEWLMQKRENIARGYSWGSLEK
jgi:amicoumacin kinase